MMQIREVVENKKSEKAIEGYAPYIEIGDIDIETKMYSLKEKSAVSGAVMARKGDILVSTVRPTRGAITIVHENDPAVSSAFAILKPNQKVCNPKFLYYCVCSKPFLQYLGANSKGATYPTCSKNDILDYDFKMLSIEAQSDAVQKMDEISNIILKRSQQILLLDELIIARFVEMFGTLDNPAQKFEKATLKELCNKITDGKHGGCTQEEGTERYFVGAREIFDDEVHYDTAPQINIEEFEKDYKRCNVEIGDFLIVNTGATIGKSAIASDIRTTQTLLQKSVALLKVKQEVLNPVFLKWCYRVNTKMYLVESASAQPNLLLSKINSTVIYVPDIDLQKQFAEFVAQVDKSKVAIQKALDETHTLFDSLMQEYFG